MYFFFFYNFFHMSNCSTDFWFLNNYTYFKFQTTIKLRFFSPFLYEFALIGLKNISVLIYTYYNINFERNLTFELFKYT